MRERFPTRLRSCKPQLKSGCTTADEVGMDISSFALQGLEQANSQLDAAAAQITSTGSESSGDGGVDVVDLSSEMVALMSAQTEFSSNLTTLKTVDQLEQSLIDITT